MKKNKGNNIPKTKSSSNQNSNQPNKNPKKTITFEELLEQINNSKELEEIDSTNTTNSSKMDEVPTPVFETSQSSFTETPPEPSKDKLNKERTKKTSISKRIFKYQDEEDGPYDDLFDYPDDLKRGFVMSEILNKKY